MRQSRRQTLQVAGGAGLYAALGAIGLVSSGVVSAQAADARAGAAFQAKTLPDALRAIGATEPADSRDIVIDAPDVAENGAVVPISIRSNLPGTETIALLVEKNPQPLASLYEVLPGLEPEIGNRIKMNETSDVYVVVRAGGRYYMARREVKVILGGCTG